MKNELKWIDVLKGLLVIVIYIECIGVEDVTYNFISTHHTALFFCVLGLVENFDKEENIHKYIFKKVKTVLVPCFVLAYLILIMATIQYDCGLDFVKGTNAIITKGLIRDSFAANSLWYFTCLFSIQLIFFLIKKVRFRWLAFVICLGLHCYNVVWMNSIEFPHWYFNIDSALYYMIFYATGYFVFPHMVSLFELDTRKKMIFFVITGVVSLVYSVGIYFELDILTYILPSFMWRFTSAIRAYIIIWLYFISARLLQDVKFLTDIGKNMLFLCAGEYVIRTIIGNIMSILGISFATNYPIHIFMYIGILIWIGNRYFVPVEKYLIGKIVREV